MLSGLNNLKVYTLLNEKYEQYFGFTEGESNGWEIILNKQSLNSIYSKTKLEFLSEIYDCDKNQENKLMVNRILSESSIPNLYSSDRERNDLAKKEMDYSSASSSSSI